MSTSVIRILPKKKIERHVVPYSFLLGRVLTKRSLQAVFVVVLTVSLVSPVLKYVLWLNSIRRITFTLALSALPVFLRSKLLLTAERPVYSSLALKAYHTICSRQFGITLVLFAMSTYIYFVSLLGNQVPLATLQRAEFDKRPNGIPASLALHQTDKWYLVHQNYLYLYGFCAFAAVMGAALEMNHVVLDVDPLELGMKPLRRILRRASRVQCMLRLWVALTVAWPLIYWAGARKVLFRSLTVGLKHWKTRELDDFSLTYLLLPIKLIPLMALWSYARQVFMAYLSLGPVHKNRPISDLGGSGKNSSLLNGVSQPANTIVTRFAWNELLYIAEHEAPRREHIFGDIDGDEVVWDQIHAVFVKLLRSRIEQINQSTPKHHHADKSATQSHAAPSQDWFSSTDEILGHPKPGENSPKSTEPATKLPKRTVKPLESSIFRPETALEKRLAKLGAQLETDSRREVTTMRHKLVHLATQCHVWITKRQEMVLATPFGHLFLHTVERAVSQRLSDRQTTVFAMRAMARMITQSLHEDQNGYVQSTVGATLSVLDDYATALEKLLKSPPVSKLDIRARQSETKPNLAVVESMLAEANSAFLEIVQVMSPYYENLNITKSVKDRSYRATNGELSLAETVWLPYAYLAL